MALTTRQLKVIDSLFKMGGDEKAVMKKHRISHRVWHKWVSDKDFVEGITSKLKSYKMASQILLAKYNSLAAARLVQLCESKNQETSRKACLDIITLEENSKQKKQKTSELPAKPRTKINNKTASKILAVLAEDKNKKMIL